MYCKADHFLLGDMFPYRPDRKCYRPGRYSVVEGRNRLVDMTDYMLHFALIGMTAV